MSRRTMFLVRTSYLNQASVKKKRLGASLSLSVSSFCRGLANLLCILEALTVSSSDDDSPAQVGRDPVSWQNPTAL
ncbi:hypothetical protein N7493_004197 [Penicillium malachiteum]|uniref:Uncharacterized protein n=1 Tax=Penicillium malachiteum TaxID=1324776 RepID=A0AAD6HRQ3_9EURO|nr:hypothetical protein N7493_004197 [Penicillium malachiteum]